MTKTVLLVLALTASGLCMPQQQQGTTQDIDAAVADIFSLVQSTPTPARPTVNRGFGQIVTPEPIVEPTTAPQTLIRDDGNRCTCVPYYLCDPDTNTTITDGEFDGFGQIDIRFDPESCVDVLDVCCLQNSTQETPLTPTPVAERPNRVVGCGVRNVGGIDFQIVGNVNNEAGFGEFPWTVALLHTGNSSAFCGGSLIHPQVVLTGQHCAAKVAAGGMKVRAGEWDTQTTKERLPFQERGVRQVLSHPQYNARNLANDIALLVLESPVELADHINVVCLPPHNFVSTSQNCFSSGWGKDIFGAVGKYSAIMKRIPLPIVSYDQCQAQFKQTRLGPKFFLDRSFICAGGVKGVDTCEGDGGAPLVCPVEPISSNRYYQSGLVAWGIGCNEDRPAAYASVALARNWIDQQIRYLGFDPNVYSY